jgi:hypothetical protein
LAKSSYQDITSYVSEPESENGQAYATMRSLFQHTKRVYSTKSAFLSPTELGMTEPSQIEIIRKANMASFVSSIFGSQEISFAELNDHFFDVFVPEGSRLLKVQGALFLELKTQAFIAAFNNPDRSRTSILFELFPDDLEQRLLSKRTGNRQLAPSEGDFVKRARSRRDILLNDINNEEALNALPDKYHWEDFLRDLATYISKSFDTINSQPVSSTSLLEYRLKPTDRQWFRARRFQKDDPQVLVKHLKPLVHRLKRNLRWLLSLQRYHQIAIYTVILSREQPEQLRLLYRDMGYASLSNPTSSNSSSNQRNRPKGHLTHNCTDRHLLSNPFNSSICRKARRLLVSNSNHNS